MRSSLFGTILLLGGVSAGFATGPAAELEYGPFAVGFEIIQTVDICRPFPAEDGSGFRGRPMRAYIWYPARETSPQPLTVGNFVCMASDDFRLSRGISGAEGNDVRLPVPLAKGLDTPELQALMRKPMKAGLGVRPAQGKFPLIVLGQGLYYESPLSQAVLSEYLASRGYVVATCPLLGTQYRLVNMTAEDLETQIRDLEFVIATARSHHSAESGRLGVVGYDLGGMAGLVLAMRNPEVDAFLSMDCAIQSPHFSGLPGIHPSYREDLFTIPWMHIAQSRFAEAARQSKDPDLLSDRKKFGDTWIVTVPTENHGQFSSYAMFGIRRAVRGYWGPVAADIELLHDAICRLAGDFFDVVLKSDAYAAQELRAAAEENRRGPLKTEYKKGAAPPPSSRLLMHRIIEKGPAAGRKEIDNLRSADPGNHIFIEAELHWLGYHLLLWWGREDEALEVFRLSVELNPRSAAAYAGLGETCLVLARTDEAVAALRKALELDPDLPNVKAALERLEKQE
ncbi:MAG: tetratricopeptide repeat protein [Candidatus Aminicenantes bacterium]|nr:tetratricopeptide repeat protein [Candidatus Aminicenantes bacterium]